jgi:hypothetical protein
MNNSKTNALYIFLTLSTLSVTPRDSQKWPVTACVTLEFIVRSHFNMFKLLVFEL